MARDYRIYVKLIGAAPDDRVIVPLGRTCMLDAIRQWQYYCRIERESAQREYSWIELRMASEWEGVDWQVLLREDFA